MPILISKVEKMSINNFQNFQLLNVTFNNIEDKSTNYDFNFLKHLEKGSFSIHGDCKSTAVEKFNSFKDNLKVMEVFNCVDILQIIQPVKLTKLPNFNKQLNFLSEWLPNLKTLDLKMYCKEEELFELTLDGVKFSIETFYYWNVDNISDCTPIGDPLYQFVNIDAPKLKCLEIDIDSEVTAPLDLTKFHELKKFLFNAWTHENLILGNNKLKVCKLASAPKIKIIGDLPALKKIVCGNNIEEKLKESNVDLSKFQPLPTYGSFSSEMHGFDLDQELQKISVSSFSTVKSLGHI